MPQIDVNKPGIFENMCVCIPYKDTIPRYIRDILRSIFDNPLQPSNILFVNDYSTHDNLEQLTCDVGYWDVDLKSYISIISTDKDTIGCARAFNTGLEWCHTNNIKYVKFMGSDDVFLMGYFAVLQDALKTLGADAIRMKMKWFFESHHKMQKEAISFGPCCYDVEKLYTYKFPEGMPRHIEQPVIEAFNKKYKMASIDFEGEIYRIHENNVSHTPDGTLKGKSWRLSYGKWKRTKGNSIDRG